MLLKKFIRWGLTLFATTYTGVTLIWRGSQPDIRPRVYFANHHSHGDFVLLWAALPSQLQALTRPVAAADYWQKNRLNRFMAEEVFRCVMVSRYNQHKESIDPILPMLAILKHGESLIIFPEGTRNNTDNLLPFKSGIYYLAEAAPEIEFIPVWIQNSGHAMPKGVFIPLPLLCSLTFGEAIYKYPNESKDDFILRAQNALLDLKPKGE